MRNNFMGQTGLPYVLQADACRIVCLQIQDYRISPYKLAEGSLHVLGRRRLKVSWLVLIIFKGSWLYQGVSEAAR